jgi:hypothetical protein
MGFTQATAPGGKRFKSLVANDETGLEVLTLKDLLGSNKVSRQPKRETWQEIQGIERKKREASYRVRTARLSSLGERKSKSLGYPIREVLKFPVPWT